MRVFALPGVDGRPARASRTTAVLLAGLMAVAVARTAASESSSESTAESSAASTAAAPAAAAVAPGSTPADPMDVLLEHLSDTGVVPLSSDRTLPEPNLPEPSASEAAPDLWARIRLGFGMPDLESRIATQRTVWYASQPDYIARMTQRSSRYLYYIVLEIERRGMPTELALLPFVESAFQPEAVSSAKAAGLWQFIPSTGKLYELTQNAWKDERRNVIESTRAALDYLEKLYNQFGDWQLALAAYNWGEGSVERAIEKKSPSTQGHAVCRPEDADRNAAVRSQAPGDQEHRRSA